MDKKAGLLFLIWCFIFTFYSFAQINLSFVNEATSLSVGESGSYAVQITNSGDSDQTVAVVVQVPSDFIVTNTGGGTYNSGDNTITYSNITVPGNGGTQNVSFEAAPSCNATSGETMTATSGSAQTTSSPIEVKYPALVITKTPTSQMAHLGDTVNWTITVKNTGNGDIVNGVTLTDTLGSGFTFVSITGPNAPSNLNSPWNTGRLNAGDSVTYTITATVSNCEAGDLKNKIEGTYSDGQNTCAHREATASVTVEIRKPELNITVSPPSPITYCGPNTVTVVVDNSSGEGPAKNVKLKLIGLLSDWTVTNVQGATYNSNTSTFEVGDISAGDSIAFNFDIYPDGSTCHSQDYFLSRRLQHLVFQPYYRDECDHEFAPPYIGPLDFNPDPQSVPRLVLSKSGPRSADRGETNLEYTLTITYVAPSNANDVTFDVIDDYPDGNQTNLSSGFVITDAGGGTDNGDTVTWSNITLSPGQNWTTTIKMDAPTDPCAPGNDYNNELSVSVSSGIDCHGCPILIVGSGDSQGNPTSTASQSTFINQPDNPVIQDSSKTVNYIDSPNGVEAAEVCSNIQYTTCFTFSSGAPSSWNGIIFTDDMPHQSFVSVDEVSVNGTSYNSSCYTITNTNPLTIDLSGLDGCGASAPNTGAQLCITFTLKAEESHCEFVDFSGIQLPDSNSGCDTDNDYDQGVLVHIGKSSLEMGTTNSPDSIDTCEIKQFRIDFNNTGECVSAFWDLYDVSVTIDPLGHYTLILGDPSYPVEFHNMQDPDGNDISSFDPTDNGNGTYTWDLGDIRHHTDRQANGPQPYITFYMKKDCNGDDSTKTWDVSAIYNDKCHNDNGSPIYNASRTPGGEMLLLRNADLILNMTPSHMSYTPYPEFEVQIINKGSGKANDAEFNINFASGLTFWDYTVVKGDAPDSVTGSQGDGSVVFHWNTLNPNQEVILKVKGHIVACSNLTLSASLYWCSPQHCQEENISREVFLPPSDAIIIEHSGEALDPCNLRNANFTIKGKNSGDTDIFHIHIEETLPPGISYVSNSATYTITSGYGNSSGSLEPTINGQTLDWDFSSILPTNSDGDRALDPDGIIEIHFQVSISNCSQYQGSDEKSTAVLKYDRTCESSTLEPDSTSSLSILVTSFTNPHVSIRKRGRNITKGSGWVEDEVDGDLNDVIEWELTYTSNGDYTAVNCVISDTLPSNVTLVSGSFNSTCSGCTSSSFFGSGCNIGNLDVGNSCTITYRTTINSCTSQPTTNEAKAQYDCDCMRRESKDSVNLNTEPQLANSTVTLHHSNWTTCGGDITIEITNNGGTAINQSIVDNLPSGFVYDSSGGCNISFSNTPAGTTHGSGIPNCSGLNDGDSTLTWDSSNVDFIAPGETLTITFHAKQDGTYCDTTSSNDSNDPDVSIPDLQNNITFNYQNSCGNESSVNATDNINPTQPDIDVTITPLQQTVPEGGTASWTITLTNEGDAPAYNITLTDTLGSGFSNISDNQGGNWSGNVGTWNISGPISPGGSWSVVVSATVGQGSLINSAVVDGMCKDSGGSDICTYTHDETSAYTAGFQITKSVDKTEANVGEELTYNIVAKFTNTDTFTNVEITDVLPNGVDYISATQNGGDFSVSPTVNGQTLQWNLGTFTGPKEFNYLVRVRIKNDPANGSGIQLLNNATATFGIDYNGDSSEDANFTESDGATTTVREPHLTIQKNITPSTNVEAGEEVTITLTVDNTGDGPAYGISISDLLNDTDNDGDVDGDDVVVYDCSTVTEDTTPSGFAFSVSGTSPACSVNYTSNGDTSIPAGGSLTFTFKVKISHNVITGSSYTNKADVIGHSLPPSDSEYNNSSYDRTVSGSGTHTISVVNAGTSSKTILSTSENFTDPGDSNANSNPPVAVGEVVEVEIRFTFPQGTTNHVRLYDRMRNLISSTSWGTYLSGSAYLARNSTSLTCSADPGNINSASPNTFVSVDSDIATSTTTNYSYVRLDLEDVVNTDTDTSTTEEYIFRFKVVVNNNASTNAGSLLRDEGRLRYRNADGVNHYVHTNERQLHVAEPVPSIDKVANPTTAQGGDTITFTLTICNNASGSDGASGFDWRFTDNLPSDYENPQITNIDTGTTGATVNASFSGNTLSGTIDRLDSGECITITYTADLKSDVSYSDVITNTVSCVATSLPGDYGSGGEAPGSPGSETGERTGNGGVNDLYVEDSASVTISQPTLSKDIENYQSYYAIGEEAQFVITIGVPEGTTNNFVIKDQLPSGLSFVSGTLNVVMPSNLSSSNSPLTESNSNFFNYDSGNNVLTFDFGTITASNSGNIEIHYRALVENVIGNQGGVLLTNSATLTYEDPSDPTQHITVGPVQNSHSVRVGEPNLNMDKVITAGATGSEAGDTVSWRVDISNAGHTVAYQVDWKDILPDGLYHIHNAHISISGGNVYHNGTTTPLSDGDIVVSTTNNNQDTISLPLFQIDSGATISISFDSVLMDSVFAGMVLTNSTRASYTSLVNGGRDNSSSPGNVDDDDDSVLNNYEESTSRSLTVSSEIDIDKTVDKSTATIGETVTFTIRVDVIEGITPNVKVYDTLPGGLTYVSHSITTGHIGMSFGNPNYDNNLGSGQTVYFDFGDVNNPSNGDDSDDYFTIEIVARVDNSHSNQDGVALKNGEVADGSSVYVEYGSDPNSPGRVDFDYDPSTPGIQGLPVNVVEPDLTITKTAEPDHQSLGDIVVFTIRVSHTGNSHSDAYDIEVNDTLPAGLTFVNCSLPSSDYTVSGQNLTFRKSSLTLGAPDNGVWEFTYRARVDVDAVVGNPLTNGANLTYKSISGANGNSDSGRTGDDCGIPNPLNDYCSNASASIIPTTTAFIDATKEVSLTVDADGSGTVTPGDTLTYTINLENTNGDVSGVVFTDTVPDNTTYVAGSLNSTVGTTDDSNLPTLRVDIGDMNSGATVQITFQVTVDSGTPAGTIISNQGVVDSDNTVPEPTDSDGNDTNGDQPTDVVVGGSGGASMYVWKYVEWSVDSDSDGSVTPGDIMTYWVLFENSGSEFLTEVSFVDTIPSGLTYNGTSYVSSGALNIAGNSVSLSGMTIAPGDTEYIYFQVVIDSWTAPPQERTYVNQGIADSDETQPINSDGNGDPSDGEQPTEFSAVVPGIGGSPNVVVDKSWEVFEDNNVPGEVNPGDELRYTIVIENTGSSHATNVHLSDQIPQHTTLVYGSITTSKGVVISENPIEVNIGNLNPGEIVIVQFRVLIDYSVPDGTSEITNTATATADGGISVSDTATTPLDLIADLSITKSDSPDPVIAGNILTYTITVSNGGPNGALNVVVSDSLPSQVENPEYSTDGGSTWHPWTGSLNLGDISAGGNVGIVIRGTVLSSTPDGIHLTNSATVSSDTSDQDTTNNTSSADTTVNTSADLSVLKTDSSDPVLAGDEITYTITITNGGPSDAQNVELSDTMPSEIQNPEYSLDGGSNWSGWTGSVSLGTINSGGSVQVLIRGVVDPSTLDGTHLHNVATVSSTTTDPNSDNNSDDEDTTVNTSADLSITKSDNPDPVRAGEELVYTLVVHNAGPSDARNVQISDDVPTDVENPEYSTDGGNTWQPWSGSVNLGVVASGDSITVLLKGTVSLSTTGTILNSATVSSDTSDGDFSNNSDDEYTDVREVTDLVLEKSVDNSSPNVGDEITFTIRVENNGLVEAENVRVEDILLPGIFTYISSSVTTGSYDDGSGVWSVGNLNPGDSAQLTISVRVEEEGFYENYSLVTSDTLERDYANNSDTAPIGIGEFVDIAVSKISSVENASSEDEFTFHVVVRNLGNVCAHGVVVLDEVPMNVSLVDFGTTVGSYNPSTGEFIIGTLCPDEFARLDLRVRINGGGEVINIASVLNVDEEDIDQSNNSSSAVVNGSGNELDLGVDKYLSGEPILGTEADFVVKTVNFGPADATGVVVSDILPSGVSFVSYTSTQGTYDAGSGVWTVGDMGVGDYALLVIRIRFNDLTDFTNTASIQNVDQNDVNPNNDEDSVSGTILGCDVSLESSVDKRCPYVGQPIFVTFKLSNVGEGDANEIRVATGIPPELDVVSVDGDGTFNTQIREWRVLSLLHGNEASITLKCIQVVGSSDGCRCFSSNAYYVYPTDIDMSNNNSECCFHMGKKSNSDLAIFTSVGNYLPVVGEEIEVYFEVKNNGQDPAYSVMGEFFIDGSVNFVNWDGYGVDVFYPQFFIPELMVGDMYFFVLRLIPMDRRDYHYSGVIYDDLINDFNSSNNEATGRFTTRDIYHWSPGGIGDESGRVVNLDVNGDGKINIVDLYELANYIVGNISTTNDVDRFDLNEDGEVNIGDVELLKYYLSSKMF